MKFELKRYNRENRKNYQNVTNEELIEDLIRVSKKLQKDKITHYEYNIEGKFHSNVLARRFGGWTGALKEAGLKKTRNWGISNEEAFENLEEVWIKLGRQPTTEELNSSISKYSASFYAYRFGTLQKALEKFVNYANNEEKETIEEMKKDSLDETHKTKRGINLRLRFIIMKRDNFKCRNCGRSPATDPKVILHIDHIKPWANGGETTLDNLQTLCSKCNVGKSNLQ